MRKIFVFGSNLAGIHGHGVGLAGNSYAIPTKDKSIRTMRLEDIESYVHEFMAFAKANPGMQFNIVAIGCGLAGFTPRQIAPMFEGATDNCVFIGDWNLV